MLSQLYIKNVAVISEATINFSDGLNAFTGETGAGKTILIQAINAILGERTSKELIRFGENYAIVSALFTDLSQEVMEALRESGYPSEENTALLYREIGTDGKSYCKLDGRPATAAILKKLAPFLINIHGQHDNQQLLSPQKHLGFIDGFGGLFETLVKYQKAYYSYTRTCGELKAIDNDDAEKTSKIDILRYQIDEIDEADLQDGEEDDLKSQRKLIQNAVNVTTALGGTASLLDGDDENAGFMSIFSQIMDYMSDVGKYFDTAGDTAERITDIYYEFEGISAEIHGMLEEFDCNPSQLDEIENRLDLIYRLKKKYGGSIKDILTFRDNASNELLNIETSGERAEKMRVLLEKQLDEANKLANELSMAREKASKEFIDAVQEELRFLDMPSVKLSIKHSEKPISVDGIDAVELFIATNAGESAKSLAKTASGGELSRIMLSIKNVLAGKDGAQTMIFDEVDTGVSGRAAQKIGQKLSQVSNNRQVIVVTHLAQVASYARRHLLIEKETRGNRTFTSITALNREERVHELARINAGAKISNLALSHAEEMLREAGN